MSTLTEEKQKTNSTLVAIQRSGQVLTELRTKEVRKGENNKGIIITEGTFYVLFVDSEGISAPSRRVPVAGRESRSEGADELIPPLG
jgi:hypothetical protein